MKRFTAMLVALFACSALLAGCANLKDTITGHKKETGTVAGAAAGAAVGHAVGGGTVSTVLGALAGGVLGEKAGEYWQKKDSEKTAKALSANQPVSWKNSDTGNNYTVNPDQSFQRNGRTCRHFTMDVNLSGGGAKQVHGTACQQPDGNWKVVS